MRINRSIMKELGVFVVVDHLRSAQPGLVGLPRLDLLMHFMGGMIVFTDKGSMFRCKIRAYDAAFSQWVISWKVYHESFTYICFLRMETKLSNMITQESYFHVIYITFSVGHFEIISCEEWIILLIQYYYFYFICVVNCRTLHLPLNNILKYKSFLGRSI